jgi:hypothetical protein
MRTSAMIAVSMMCVCGVANAQENPPKSESEYPQKTPDATPDGDLSKPIEEVPHDQTVVVDPVEKDRSGNPIPEDAVKDTPVPTVQEYVQTLPVVSEGVVALPNGLVVSSPPVSCLEQCQRSGAKNCEAVCNQPVSVPKNERYHYLGMLFDISVPSGVALGLAGRLPSVPWFKLGLAATGTIAPGIRGNVEFDPIKFPIAPILNMDVGHQFPFSIPSVKNSPDVEFSYVDFQGGLGLGNRDVFRFELLAGMSYLFGGADNFQGVIGSLPAGLKLGNPSFDGWIPNVKLGFTLLF